MSTRSLLTTAAESDIADLLGAAEAQHPAVSIGSYPQFRTKPYTVKITLDSRDQAQLMACFSQLSLQLAEWLLPPDGGP